MGIVGTVLWIFSLLFVLHLALPNAEMGREGHGKGTYYLLWAAMLSTILFVQYQVMSGYGQGHAAMMIDFVCVGLFTGECAVVAVMRRLRKMQSNATHAAPRSRRAQPLSLMPARTDTPFAD